MSSYDERLQQAARKVVDGNEDIGAVARAFGVNEQHLGEAVWYMKQNRQRAADERLQEAARKVVDGNEDIGAVARAFGVNEQHLGEAVWYMKQNRQREAPKREAPKRKAPKRRTAQRSGPPFPPPEGCYWKWQQPLGIWVPVRERSWDEDPS